MTMRAFDSHRLQLTPTIRLIANERLDLRAGMGESQLGEKLTERDVERVTNFLKSLTGGPPTVHPTGSPPNVERRPRP
jgi:hypothetical protein